MRIGGSAGIAGHRCGTPAECRSTAPEARTPGETKNAEATSEWTARRKRPAAREKCARQIPDPGHILVPVLSINLASTGHVVSH